MPWLLKELIDRGVDINGEAAFKSGYTPLVHHLSHGCFETAEMLLDLGANLPPHGVFDLTRDAVVKGEVSFLKRLLRHSKETGVSIEWNGTATYFLELCNFPKKTATVTSLHYIAFHGFVEILDFYIAENLLGDFDITTADGYTAVHFAAFNNQAAVIHQLHFNGASLTMQCHDGSTALHLAVRTKSLSATKILLELGAKDSPDAIAMTPRMHAMALKDEDMIELLDRHFAPDAAETSFFDYGRSTSWKRMKFLARVFEDAIAEGDLEECQRLCRAGCLDVSMPSCHGCSPLIKALRHQRLHIVEWLLDCRATTSKVACNDHGGLTVIELAIWFSTLNPVLNGLLVRWIEEGGDLFGDRQYALAIAIHRNNMEGLKILLDIVEEKSEIIR